jgi:GNAT superfamily N-acetyltransferase
MQVRKMHPREIDATLDLLDLYFQEAVESIPEMADQWDEESMINFVRQHAAQWQYAWLNAYVNDEPVGLIAGCVTAAPWNDQILTGHISMVFLQEEHRSMDNFRTLVDYFEQWAAGLGCRRLTASDIGINPARTEKIYNYLGWKPAVFVVKDIE